MRHASGAADDTVRCTNLRTRDWRSRSSFAGDPPLSMLPTDGWRPVVFTTSTCRYQSSNACLDRGASGLWQWLGVFRGPAVTNILQHRSSEMAPFWSRGFAAACRVLDSGRNQTVWTREDRLCHAAAAGMPHANS